MSFTEFAKVEAAIMIGSDMLRTFWYSRSQKESKVELGDECCAASQWHAG